MAKGKKGFEPGVSGNPEGRPSGVPNKIARPIKEQLADFLNLKIQELPEIWLKLSARDKSQFIKDILPFFMARLQSVELSGDVNFHALPEYQLDQFAEKLKSETQTLKQGNNE